MKLHLGCGKRILPGYIHVDLSDYSHIDYKIPVNDLSVFADESVDLIYASHVLEYFDFLQAEQTLIEWKRVLKKDGILRLAVPDFDALLKVYDQTNNIDSIIGPLFGRWQIVGTDGMIYHKTVFTRIKLEQLLIKVGFSSVNLWDWRTVFIDELSGFDDYAQAYFPHMDKDNGLLISLNLECKK